VSKIPKLIKKKTHTLIISLTTIGPVLVSVTSLSCPSGKGGGMLPWSDLRKFLIVELSCAFEAILSSGVEMRICSSSRKKYFIL